MSRTFPIRDYSKDELPKHKGVLEVVDKRLDTNDYPIACDHCRENLGPLIRIGALYRVFVCQPCLEEALGVMPERTQSCT